MSETHLNEIRIDKSTHASGVRDLTVATTTGEVITENNTLQGQKKSEIPLEEDEDWYPSWLRHVMQEEIEPKILQQQGHKIPVVSSTAGVRGGRDCYIPKVVSIGPYHYLDRTEELGDVEKLKAPMTRQYVKACGQNMLKKKYAEVQRVANIFGSGPREPICFWVILRILFLIFDTVDVFVSLIKCLHLSDIISYCCHGLRICLPDSDQQQEPQRKVEEAPRSEGDNEEAPRSGGDNEPAHLLEFLYSIFMKSENRNDIYSKLIHGNTKWPPQIPGGHYLYYSAKNLKRVGIHFQASWHGDLRDVEFKSSIFFGTLKIPSIAVNESTKLLILNLVAYEEYTSCGQSWVASYICFMDSLINDAEDVEELRSKGILVNFLGADQQVADLFNDMGTYLKPDASTYNDIKRKINKQCESRISKWVAEWQQKYFGSPWTIIAVLAAAFALALTATQTYYTKYPSRK